MYNQSGVNRPNVTDLVIVFTDGASTKKVKTETEANKFKEKKTKVFAIGAGRYLGSTLENELKTIASKDDYYLKVEKLEDIHKIVPRLLNKVLCDHVKTSRKYIIIQIIRDCLFRHAEMLIY